MQEAIHLPPLVLSAIELAQHEYGHGMQLHLLIAPQVSVEYGWTKIWFLWKRNFGKMFYISLVSAGFGEP